MDTKPKVFPTQKEIADANNLKEQEKYEAERYQVAGTIYSNSANETGHYDAIEAMRRRTEEQLAQHNQKGVVEEPSLSENKRFVSQNYEKNNIDEQIKLRDQQLKMNAEQTKSYQEKSEQAMNRKQEPTDNGSRLNPPNKPPVNTPPVDYGEAPKNINPYIIEISQPQFSSAFDVIPLPSEGKLYRTKQRNVKVAYLTTADENILTSPNLLQSGEFLEILINRKLLDTNLRYKDLHVGDRNAIMLWLRATGYGEIYPVTLLDNDNVPFDTEINLNELKTIKLGAEPDENGLFDFVLPLSKTHIKFKLLTVGEMEDIEKRVEADKNNDIPVNNLNTYILEKQIVSVNGETNKYIVNEFANNIRVFDAKSLRDYISSIESGIDMNIEVRTPGGGSVKSFLPLNVSFFWPNIGV
jgi:hypothetical protein